MEKREKTNSKLVDSLPSQRSGEKLVVRRIEDDVREGGKEIAEMFCSLGSVLSAFPPVYPETALKPGSLPKWEVNSEEGGREATWRRRDVRIGRGGKGRELARLDKFCSNERA